MSQKLVQIQTPVHPQVGLQTEESRRFLAQQIKQDIDAYCLQAYSDGFRSHLGASEIGHKCDRYLWYKFRWMARENHPGLTLRLFNRGKLEELRFREWLIGIGAEILDSNTQERMSAVGGHFGGSRDGLIRLRRYGIDALLLTEYKTNGTGKGFNELLDSGIEHAKPQHWAQICVYGEGFNIDYCLYLNICKNDDNIHCEVKALDRVYGRNLIERASRIIRTPVAPEKLSKDPSYYECKWCPARKICHESALPVKNCRSCVNASPEDKGEWRCAHFNANIPREWIAQGCDQWRPLG